jgi:hypothetical protein
MPKCGVKNYIWANFLIFCTNGWAKSIDFGIFFEKLKKNCLFSIKIISLRCKIITNQNKTEMKKNIIFIGLTTITLLIMIMVNSCSKDNNIVDAVNPQEQVSTHFIELTTQENTMLTVLTRPTPKVSTSEVEEIVDNFFNSSVSAKNIIPLKKNGISKSSETDVDTMMYIVDFNDKEGWVIVSGDVRVPQKILAYSDEGVIDTTDEADSLFLWIILFPIMTIV